MTTFTNRNDQAGYGHNLGGPNANAGGYNNAGPGGFNNQGMGQYDQTGTGVRGGQDFPPNQHDFASGGGPTDPAFNNNYPNTGHHHGQGHHNIGGTGAGNTGFTGGTGAGNAGITGGGGPGAGNAGFTGGPGAGNAGFTGGTGAGNTGFTGPTGQHHGAGGPGATGGYTNTGGAGANAPGRAANGASAGEKELVGKIERVAGDVLCSSTLKAKGAEKEREAQALKAQAAELNQAEGLESEAAMRRQRAVAHGAHPQHLGGNHHHMGGDAPRRV